MLFDETKAFEDGAQVGEVALPDNQEGSVEVRFNNMHSKLRSKAVLHRFSVS